jgi:Fe-S cluster biogenesis protein NfuA
METKKIPVALYAESTPNPATMKFVANKMLILNGATVEYVNPSEANICPLALRLFSFPFVNGVFIASNFITVTKNNTVEWDEITMEVREYISNYLQAGYPIFTEMPKTSQHHSSDKTKGDFIPVNSLPANEVEEKIINILEEYVRPAVEGDGGAIHFKSFENGILTVVLRGACSGCPSSSVTLKNGIKSLFDRMLPQVQDVVAEEA